MIASSSQPVFMSLDAGKILQDDVSRFEIGLKALKWLPAYPWSTTVPEELSATGLLKEPEGAELRELLAQLAASAPHVELVLTFGREAISQQSIVSNVHVNLSYDGPPITADEIHGLTNPVQGNVSVHYDYKKFAANTILKNHFFVVVEAQYDVYGLYEEQCERFDRIQERLGGTASL